MSAAGGLSLRHQIGALTLAALALLLFWTSGPAERTWEQASAPGTAEAESFFLEASGGVRFEISALGIRRGFEESGGNLVGVEIAGQDLDFGSMTTFLDRTFPRQGRYLQLSRQEDGSILSAGEDSASPDVGVQTVWKAVPPTSSGVLAQLSITTSIANRGEVALEDYELGDIVAWGRLEHFAPGPGRELSGVDKALDWVGASGPGGALLLAATRRLTGPHGSSWSDPVWTSVDLAPGESASYERQLLVGRSLGDLHGPALALQGRATSSLRLEAAEEGTGAPLGGVELIASRTSAGGELEPVVPTTTSTAGAALLQLEPGRYQIESRSSSRRSIGSAKLELSHQPQDPTRLQLSKPGRLKLSILDGSGKAVPARVDFEGLGDTPTPDLGPAAQARGRNRVHLLEPTEIDLPPGQYRLRASHGPAWSIDSTEVEVAAAELGVPLPEAVLTLAPAVAVPGWRQCDFHQHSSYSPDSSIPPIDGLIASAAEGLDCIATTDHDAVADWREHLSSAGLAETILWLPGIEVTSEVVGHYNAFPWSPDLGTVEHRGLTSAEVVEAIRQRAPEALLQLNHPLWGDIGLWKLVGLDPETGRMKTALPDGTPSGISEDYDLIELLNGKDTEHAEEVLAAWLLRVAGGDAPRAVGNSDSHRIVGQERGASRTWVQGCLDAPITEPEHVAEALRAGCRATASTGPFLDLREASPQEGADPSAVAIEVELLAPSWMAVDHIELYGGGAGENQVRSQGTWRPGVPYLDVERDEGRVRWILRLSLDPQAVDGWVVAVARGVEPMAPWSDGRALAVTNPLPLRRAPSP